MSLFSSPALRVFNSENSESLAHRKQGSNVLLARKPFVDRTVNCNTPDFTKKQKQCVAAKEPVKNNSPCTTEDLEIKPEDYFSYKDVEDEFEDLLPYSKRLEEHHVFSIIRNYLNSNTPPQSPSLIANNPIKPVELTEADFDSSFNSNESYDDDMFFKLPKSGRFGLEDDYEVDVPVIDIDDF